MTSSLVDAYKRLPIQVVRGEGTWVHDAAGRAYLDMYGGHAVTATGHCHPRLVKALREQVGKLLFYSNAVGLEHQEEAATLLVDMLPAPLARAFFVNSGTEAVENALKVARKATGREGVLSFTGGFHGRTLGALSATGIARYRDGAGVKMTGHAYVPFGDLTAVEQALVSGRFAAVILEPIQSLAGVVTAEASFFQGLRKLCDETGTLLIYDELQTGIGRTGTFTFAPRHGVVPDLMTLGKAMASGVPMGACVMTEALAATLKPGDLGTTFGGGPLASLALKVTLEILSDEDLLDRVRINAADLVEGLAHLPYVEEVRGEGFLIGVKVNTLAATLQKELLALGVIVGTSEDPRVLRLMPPLTLSRTDIGWFLAKCGEISCGSRLGMTELPAGASSLEKSS